MAVPAPLDDPAPTNVPHESALHFFAREGQLVLVATLREPPRKVAPTEPLERAPRVERTRVEGSAPGGLRTIGVP